MNYYQILEVSPKASFEEIKHAYHEQIKLWHPDLFSHDDELHARAEERTKQINHAFKMIELFLACGTLDSGPGTIAAEPVQPKVVPTGRVVNFNREDLAPERPNRLGRFASFVVLVLLTVPLATIGMPSVQTSTQHATTRRLTALPRISSTPLVPAAVKTPAAPREVSIDIPLRHSMESGPSPLIRSAMACNANQTRMLLAQGTDVNEVDARGETALIWTVKVNCLSVAELLVNRGADIHAASASGLSAVAWARNYRNRKLVELFAGTEDRAPRQAARRTTGSPLSQIS